MSDKPEQPQDPIPAEHEPEVEELTTEAFLAGDEATTVADETAAADADFADRDVASGDVAEVGAEEEAADALEDASEDASTELTSASGEAKDDAAAATGRHTQYIPPAETPAEEHSGGKGMKAAIAIVVVLILFVVGGLIHIFSGNDDDEENTASSSSSSSVTSSSVALAAVDFGTTDLDSVHPAPLPATPRTWGDYTEYGRWNNSLKLEAGQKEARLAASGNQAWEIPAKCMDVRFVVNFSSEAGEVVTSLYTPENVQLNTATHEKGWAFFSGCTDMRLVLPSAATNSTIVDYSVVAYRVNTTTSSSEPVESPIATLEEQSTEKSTNEQTSTTRAVAPAPVESSATEAPAPAPAPAQQPAQQLATSTQQPENSNTGDPILIQCWVGPDGQPWGQFNNGQRGPADCTPYDPNAAVRTQSSEEGVDVEDNE
ncbi:MAG: hypothetical protein Q3976_01610 [Corynebacterium sp.]|nr:hypothetical protein [Corynebacterium sp.]